MRNITTTRDQTSSDQINSDQTRSDRTNSDKTMTDLDSNPNLGDSAAQKRRRGRLTCYAVAAASASLGAAEVDAAIISSTAVGWLGGTNTVGGAISATPSISDRTTFGDARLDAALYGRVFQGSVGAFPLARFAVMVGRVGGAEFMRNRLATGAAVGISTTVTFHMTVPCAASVAATNGPFQRYHGGAGYPWSLAPGTGAASVRGYLGFRIPDGASGFYFGWFDVTVSRDGTGHAGGTVGPATFQPVGTPSYFSLTIHAWAYDDTGAAILAGQTSAVPGGAGLAALAVGASGLRRRRRTR